MAERLQEENGPELVVVVPEENSGWLEEGLMSSLRTRLIGKLERADRYNRLRVYSPTVRALGDRTFDLHSKVLIIDDAFLTIGSANVSNRSMRLDTECNLSIAFEGDDRIAAGIQRFRNELLSEYLRTDVASVVASLRRTDSLIATIDQLSDSERGLTPIGQEIPKWLKRAAPESSLADPEAPISYGYLSEAVAPQKLRHLTRFPLIKLATAAVLTTGIGITWRLLRPRCGRPC